MNQQSHSLFTLAAPMHGDFISLLSITLLICLPVSTVQLQAQAQQWNQTGSLSTGRFGHTSTLLANGKVLVVGGRVCMVNSCTEFNSAELYDPATGIWSTTGNLSVARHAHVAVRLSNGKVLVAGGHGGATTWNSAELYDPDTGTWSQTGTLAVARAFATATLLANDKVLVAGGIGFSSNDSSLNTAELYDPTTGAWTSAGTMNVARSIHTATLLADGRVLIASGNSGTFGNPVLQNSAELYDPATGQWTPTGSLATARVFHTETLLLNGKVLITGGSNFVSIIYDTAELYDPESGQWSGTGRMTSPRISHTATLLMNEKVLAVAGLNNQLVDSTQRSTELYNPATGDWTRAADLNLARGNHASTLLANGKVLVSGGNGGGSNGHTSAELYDSNTVSPQITNAYVSGKKLFVQGHRFDDGANVLLNDEKQKTANDVKNPTTSLIAKKAGKKIGRGETVRLKVLNSDGIESAEYSFTRPVE